MELFNLISGLFEMVDARLYLVNTHLAVFACLNEIFAFYDEGLVMVGAIFEQLKCLICLNLHLIEVFTVSVDQCPLGVEFAIILITKQSLAEEC